MLAEVVTSRSEVARNYEGIQPANLTLNEIDFYSGEPVATYNMDLFIVGSDGGTTFNGDHNYVGVFTDNPEMMLALYSEGPTALDDPKFTAGDSVTVVESSTDKIGVSSKYDTLAYSNTLSVTQDKLIILDFDRKRTDISATDTDLTQSHIEIQLDVESPNTLRKILDIGNGSLFTGYRHTHGYRQVPQITAVYNQLGLVDPELEKHGNALKMQVPTPGEFMNRLAALNEDETNIVDLPNIKYIHEGQISATEYVAAFVEGYFPVGVGDFYYYMHDLTSEHLDAILLYGAPLMDFMSSFASAAQELEVIHFSKDLDDGQHGDLTGSKKIGAVGQRLDTITSLMEYVAITSEDCERTLGESDLSMVEDFVVAIRNAGTLKDTIIAKSILGQGEAETLEDITGLHVVRELVSLARKKFNIQVEPKGKPVEYDEPLI